MTNDSKGTKVSSLSISNYYGDPNGAFSYQFEGGSATLNFDREDIEKILGICYDAIERSKSKMISSLEGIARPAQLGYDRAKTIDASHQTPTPGTDSGEFVPDISKFIATSSVDEEIPF